MGTTDTATAEGAVDAAEHSRIAVQGGSSSHRFETSGHSSHRLAAERRLDHLPNEKAMHTAPHVLNAGREQSDPESDDVLDDEDRGSG